MILHFQSSQRGHNFCVSCFIVMTLGVKYDRYFPRCRGSSKWVNARDAAAGVGGDDDDVQFEVHRVHRQTHTN